VFCFCLEPRLEVLAGQKAKGSALNCESSEGTTNINEEVYDRRSKDLLPCGFHREALQEASRREVVPWIENGQVL